MPEETCPHEHVAPEVCDQTLGVICTACKTVLAVCWMDDHIPESLWNRACAQDPQAKPCEQNRDNFCSLCGEPIPKKEAAPTELLVDEARYVEAEGNGSIDPTGIFVRAKRANRWGSYDIYVLTKESLMTWLRSRGGDNPWAESTVAILLNHPT